MDLNDFVPMTDDMKAAHGAGWGGFFVDEGTTAYIGLCKTHHYVVVGCVDGQWGAEMCSEDKHLVNAGYGDTPQDALGELSENLEGWL